MFVQENKIAFVMSPRLGDTLIAMTLIYNLSNQGYNITVFSNFISELKEWFPLAHVFPYPNATEAALIWNEYDILLHRYPHDIRYESQFWHRRVLSLSDLPLYRKCMNEVDLLLTLCKQILHIETPIRGNGITPPTHVIFRRDIKRVIIHPTASHKTKHWLPKNFLKLANHLIQCGFEPVFLVAAFENEQTVWIEQAGFKRMITGSIIDAAKIIAESGWFIGNDSGLGHLASCLGIPSVTLHQRRKNRISWHPGFGFNKALLPRVNLVIKSWKEQYWKYFLSTNQVIKAFLSLVKSQQAQNNNIVKR